MNNATFKEIEKLFETKYAQDFSNEVCRHCKGKTMLGIESMHCDSSECTATQTLYVLARQKYDCYGAYSQEDDVFIFKLTTAPYNKQVWCLIYNKNNEKHPLVLFPTSQELFDLEPTEFTEISINDFFVQEGILPPQVD